MKIRKQTAQVVCFVNKKTARDDSSVWRMAFHSTHRKGYQNKLLVQFTLSWKGGQCNFWGLLHCDYRRLPRWATCDGPQHDRGRSDIVMICMNFNSYASLNIFSSFIIPVLFCFLVVTRNDIYCTSVSCVWFLLPYVSLQSNCTQWKPSKLRLFISFSLWGIFVSS